MKILYIIVCNLLVLSSCKSTKEPNKNKYSQKETINEIFMDSLTKRQQIVFGDSSGMGASSDSILIRLIFCRHSKLLVNISGNGFSEYDGIYTLRDNALVEINIPNQKWPQLILYKENSKYHLKRKDGLNSLTNHILLDIADNKKALISDGDIYPHAENHIFPLKEIEKN